MKIILLLYALLSVSMAAIIKCPSVVCAEQDPLKNVVADLCYKHDKQ
jgi:hypothetical protein